MRRAMLLVLLSAPLSADTLTVSTSATPSVVDTHYPGARLSGEMLIPTFNEKLGHLKSVDIDWTAQVGGDEFIYIFAVGQYEITATLTQDAMASIGPLSGVGEFTLTSTFVDQECLDCFNIFLVNIEGQGTLRNISQFESFTLQLSHFRCSL